MTANGAPPVRTPCVIASPPPTRPGANHPSVPTAAPTNAAAQIDAREDQPTRGRARCKQQPVIGDGQKTREGAEREIERPRFASP